MNLEDALARARSVAGGHEAMIAFADERGDFVLAAWLTNALDRVVTRYIDPDLGSPASTR